MSLASPTPHHYINKRFPFQKNSKSFETPLMSSCSRPPPTSSHPQPAAMSDQPGSVPTPVDDDRVFFGCSRCQPPTQCANCWETELFRPTSYGRKASWREEPSPGTSTTSSSLDSPRRLLFPELPRSSGGASTPNFLGRLQRMPTLARKRPGLDQHGNMGPSPSPETLKQTGNQYGPPPSSVSLFNRRSNDLAKIPANVRVVNYRTIRAIGSDFQVAVGIVRQVEVFWGTTGTGKSRRAWDEAGVGAYSKCPRSKFWDGYQGQENVVVDEFRGGKTFTKFRYRCCPHITVDRQVPCTCGNQGRCQTP